MYQYIGYGEIYTVCVVYHVYYREIPISEIAMLNVTFSMAISLIGISLNIDCDSFSHKGF